MILGDLFGSVRSSKSGNLHLSVCPFGDSLFRALILHLSCSDFHAALSLSTLEEIQQSEPKILRLVKCPTYSSLKTLNVARVGAT